MVTTSIQRTESEDAALRSLAQSMGKSPEDLLRQGLEMLAEKHRLEEGRQAMLSAFGGWQDREDVSEFAEIRAELDRD